jgi:glycyl-tRNA synthetase beta chain
VGRPAAERLAEILPRVIGEIPWPKTMYWTGLGSVRFIRPIRWLVAMLGRQSIRFELQEVQAGNCTAGHRFLGKARIPVTGPQDYIAKLRRNFVLVRPGERREKVERESAKLASRRGLRVNPDEALKELVTYLNEYPTAILGDFDPDYLGLPEEILITVMRDHQKYFALRGPDGKLAPHFLAIINLDRDARGLVRAGHERVLRARFADAQFFWQADQKCRLADYLPRLKAVTFQAKLGTYWEKVERIRELSVWLAKKWQAQGLAEIKVDEADHAAELSKCDLVTGMVGEFPELQGIVGGLYAKAQAEAEATCQAVYDHYRPAGLNEALPRNLTGATVALADKLDTLVACFAVGMEPTGSSDPFALRRAALGVVLIILERKLQLSLREVVSQAAKVLLGNKTHLQVGRDTEKALVDFLVDRARHILLQRDGLAYDEVNAALAAGSDDLVDAIERTRALRAIRTTRNFEPLAVSFKRIRKILEKAGAQETWKLPGVRPELFEHEAERRLQGEAQRVAQEVGEHKRAGRYREALQRIAELRPAVDEFFDKVLVMAEQEEIRKNRLTLLHGLLGEFSTIADFSELEAREK